MHTTRGNAIARIPSVSPNTTTMSSFVILAQITPQLSASFVTEQLAMVTVPDAASTLGLLGLSIVALLAVRRRVSK
jgi:hypothetical protein